MIKKLLLPLLLIAVGITFWLITKNNQATHSTVVVQQPTKPVVSGQSIEASKSPAHNPAIPAHIDQTQSPDRLTGNVIWQTSEEAKNALQANPEKLPGDLAEEAYIKLNTTAISQMVIGDGFDVQIPQQGSSLAAEVDYITEHPNGDKTVEAFFPGMDKYFSAVFTVGSERSYAQISTPNGVYILEAQGDNAWITSRQALVASHWSGHEDGLIPPDAASDQAVPATPTESTQSNDDDTDVDDIDVDFDYVVESSSDDNP